MCPSIPYQYKDSFQDPLTTMQKRRPSLTFERRTSLSLMSPLLVHPADSTMVVTNDAISPMASLIVQTSDEVTSFDHSIHPIQPSVLRRTSLDLVMPLIEDIIPSSFHPQHYQVVRRTSLSLSVPLSKDDTLLQFTENDFNAELDKLFNHHVTDTEPPQSSCDDYNVFVDHAPLDCLHCPPSHSADSTKEKCETYLKTLVQHMQTSEKSRLKVNEIRKCFMRKWKQQLCTKEFAAMSSKTEQSRQMLLKARIISMKQLETLEKNQSKVANMIMFIKREWNQHLELLAATGSKTEHTRQMLLHNAQTVSQGGENKKSRAPATFPSLSYAAIKDARRKRNTNTKFRPSNTQLSMDICAKSSSKVIPRRVSRTRSNLALQSYQMRFFPDCA